MTSPFEVLLVEVKSLSDHDWLAFRVGERQKMRLKRALIFMQTKFTKPVHFHLATVTKGGEIEILPDFLSWHVGVKIQNLKYEAAFLS